MSHLRIESLSFQKLGPVNLAIPVGGCVSLAGPSGAGKTLFLRAIADLDPHAGTVFLDGREQSEFSGPDWRRRVAMLPAESRWWADTVGEHFTPGSLPLILPWLEQFGFNRENAAAKTMRLATDRLSSGERQRLAMIRLLASQPDVLLLDEPTANLDPINTTIFEEIVQTYRQKNDAAVLWVCHDTAQAGRVAERHFQFKEGAMVEGKMP